MWRVFVCGKLGQRDAEGAARERGKGEKVSLIMSGVNDGKPGSARLGLASKTSSRFHSRSLSTQYCFIIPLRCRFRCRRRRRRAPHLSVVCTLSTVATTTTTITFSSSTALADGHWLSCWALFCIDALDAGRNRDGAKLQQHSECRLYLCAGRVGVCCCVLLM